MKQLATILLLMTVGATLLPHDTLAEQRYAEPEFESDYVVPAPVPPAPRTDAREYADVAVLLLALLLAGRLVLSNRSRTGTFALMLFSLIYFGFVRKGCVCSVGSIQNVALALAQPAHVLPLAALAFFMLPLVFTLLCGRTFCAAVCPLGAIQDMVAIKPLRMPRWLSHALGMLRHVYLGTAVLFAATGSAFIICRFDPFVSFFRMSGHPAILIAGACLLVTGVFVARPYCRFLCPYGVILGWLSRFARNHVTITPDECIQCRLCEEACPFGAILKPTASQHNENRRLVTRRLGLILCAFPLLVIGGAWIGMQMEVPLSLVNPTVRLAEQMARETSDGEPAMEVVAFHTSGTPLADLYGQALSLRKQFRVGGCLLGGFLGIVLGANLVSLATRKKREGYQPDRATCLSCARCFSYCPRERVRKNKAPAPK